MENTPSVCLICLATGSKMFLISEYKLEQAYEHLTGHPLFDIKNLIHKLCLECTPRLINFEKFREKSLKARALMMKLVQQHEEITSEHICELFAGAWGSDSASNPQVPEDSAVKQEVSVKTEPSLTRPLTWKIKSEAAGSRWLVTKCETNLDPNKTEENDNLIEINIPSSSLNDDIVDEQCENTLTNIHYSIINESRGKTQKPKPHKRIASDKTAHASEKIFLCNLCPSKFSKKYRLMEHLRIHSGIKPHVCELCGYKCEKKSKLARHMRTHTGEKPYVCELCTYKCSLKDSLMKHMRTHTGEKPYSCELCAYKCTQKSSLVQHNRTHTGEKPYMCELCPYKSTGKNNLLTHMRTHTGEKPFECTSCEYKCSEKKGLIKHMRTHTGEKPYGCEFCPYICSEKSSLVKHIRTHTGEKPYLCELCPYKCSKKSYLMKHMSTHTSDAPYVYVRMKS